MADITKCKGVNCPIKGSCYRYTANESEFRQSYFTNNNVGYETKDGFKCDMYWGNKQEQVFNQLKDITNGTN